MKNFTKLLFSLFCLAAFNAQAGLKTSATNGDWNTAGTWSPSGVPMAEDTLIVNHAITIDEDVDVLINQLIVNSGASITSPDQFALHGNLLNNGSINFSVLGIGDGESTINNGSITTNSLATSNEVCTNNGVITSAILAVGNPVFNNYGTLSVSSLNTSDEFNNYFAIYCSGSFNMDGTVYNYADASVVTSALVTSGLLTNDGDIKSTNWVHGDGEVNGAGGNFCISDCFTNAATISGTVDICDATPGEFCDVNSGTIAASVTYCEGSPCQESLGEEEMQLLSFIIYPNPCSGLVQIQVSEDEPFSLYIYSLSGELLMHKNDIHGYAVNLDLSSIVPGQYIVVYQSEYQTYNTKLIIE